MVSPVEARKKAQIHYERHCRSWGAALLFQRLRESNGASCDQPCASPVLSEERSRSLSIPLHPPTERAALQDTAAAKSWARSWDDPRFAPFVRWGERNWPSIGRQRVPEKVELESCDAIAAFAGRENRWRQLVRRIDELAQRASVWKRNGDAVASFPPDAAAKAKRALPACEELDAADWSMFLNVLDWLMAHPHETRFARELPIRGIDTKWVENHQSALGLMYEALSGRAFTGIAMRAPQQMRMRFLDDRLAPAGIADLSTTPSQLNGSTIRPDRVIVCENLISLMSLPAMEGTLGMHGGGYRVSELAEIAWLANIPVLYWGDLDTHGFAILNQWRSHHARTSSVMMDRETLERHRDLCVEEPTPTAATLDRLTDEEQAALLALSAQGGHLRLEQERIEWSYALEHLRA